ncbi:MAG TPA: hypothetical protein VHG09_02105 [Longimicrobiales bacterium]|nr:hypothetical protein [Longimicrobiales bacterium]
MNTVLEHAARVLDHQPTRSMHAEPLHRRAVRETGVSMPYPRFMDALAALPDHFAVIPPDPVVGETAGWDPRQRSLYEAAMEAAGMTQPLIVLAERRVDPGNDRLLPPSGVSPAPATAADVFGDVHDALTHLLHAADPDEPLYAAVTGALEELHAARRVLST